MSEIIFDEIAFEIELFNLITRKGKTGLLFSKRYQLTKDMIDLMNLYILENRERCLHK